MADYDTSATEKLIQFAVGTTVGTPQMVNTNRSIYRDGCLQLLPLVCWENNMSLPFSSQEVPPSADYSAEQNYGLIKLENYYQVDRVQANIGGNINMIVQRVDGTTFFNYAQAYVSTYPAIFWWDNLNQTIYLYPIPTGCILKVFGRKLLCKVVKMDENGNEIDYPLVDPKLLQPYVFEFIGYCLAKALHIYYGLPWSQTKDAHLENLQELLADKQEQAFVRQHQGPSLTLGRKTATGSIFTLGKGLNGGQL